MTPEGWYGDPADASQERWWDGFTWTNYVRQAAPVAAEVPAQRATIPESVGVHSGAYKPTSTLVGTFGYTRSPAATGGAGSTECQVCGASPAAEVKYSSLRGLILIFVARTHRGRWCRDCGEAQYRNAQAFTMAWGWWGFFTLFLTPIALLLNLRERRKIRALGPPHDRGGVALDLGEPLTTRTGFYVTCVVLLFLVVSVLVGN